MADDLKLDAKGRPVQKVCECGMVLGRTQRLCPGCGHEFVGKHWAWVQRKREATRAQGGSVKPPEHRAEA